MIRLDYYYSGQNSSKVNKRVTFDELFTEMQSQVLKSTIAKLRAGEKDLKKTLPCVCYMGISKDGKRSLPSMMPTGLIMIDIDHVANPRSAFSSIWVTYLGLRKMTEGAPSGQYPTMLLAHITPSDQGLRLVFVNHSTPLNIEDNIKQFDKELGLSKWGNVDLACKDLTRVSFIVGDDDVLYYERSNWEDSFKNTIVFDETSNIERPTSKQSKKLEKLYKDFLYGNKLVRDIAEEYCAYYFPEGNHQPPQGSIHTFYNQMVKDFRCICDNNPEILISVLPQFGHTDEECYSQCRSICSRNNLSKLPKPFYFFLKDRNWYVSPFDKKEVKELEEEPEDPFYQLNNLLDAQPKLPPIFRQYINSAPRYFKIPYMMALLPVMGTLTSYLEGRYNGKTQTTSFMSVIYAPPSSGKSYIVDLSEQLLSNLYNRDAVSAARDNIYAKMIKMKSANEKSPDDPRTPQRIMPAINSIPKILSKMSNNAGYHMFTAVEEMDTWIKGSKGRDGDKNDMYRVAWDNGKYGQSFMSAQTFNGIIRLYWNVLITGTIDQVTNYFKNIENGMITRCSFSDLGDQSFTLAPEFKTINNRDLEQIEKWKLKCDACSYMKPLEIDFNILYDVSDKEFDDKIAWRQEFRPRQEINIDWVLPHLNKWCLDQNLLAQKNADHARGIFHRRVAVRGYRLAMICSTLYDRIRDKEKQVIVDFVLWFMDCDLYGILKLFGKRYNNHYSKSASEISEYKFADIFDSLPPVFTVSDLHEAISKTNYATNHYAMINIWKKAKLVEKIESGKNSKYKKIKK